MFKQNQDAITKKSNKMFRKHGKSIMQLISGNATLAKTIRDLSKIIKDYQRLDDLSKDIFDLKEGLQFNLEKANNLTEV